MFNPDVWSWPQWTALIFMTIAFAIEASMHGREKAPSKWNGFAGLFRFSLWTFLLVFGGFYA